MKLAWQLARRFRRTRQSGFLSFISFSSTAGIALGCFVLIVLLSVMNGFERELTQRILTFIPHGELYSVDNSGIEQWQDAQQQLKADPRVKDVHPYTKVTGMLQFRGDLKAVELTGVDKTSAKSLALVEHISDRDWSAFASQPDGVLLGRGVMEKLGASRGDAVQILIPVITGDLSFKAPHTVTLRVAGEITVGGELDNSVGVMHLAKASGESGIISGAQGLRLTLHDPFSAPQTLRDIGYAFPQPVYMSDWTRTQGHLYQDIQLVRVVVYIALTLVIAVACFNIVSSLVMAVREKQSAIAILKTMGAQDSLIRQAFMLQGMINGVTGIVIGTSGALLIAPNLSAIVATIEAWLGVTLLSGDIYFINFLPSQLEALDVVLTVVIAFILSVLATLYPAQRAVRIEPARALN
ncbi:lipoprotein-releasing ABC transporter permease subunit [Alteromonas halophila]|uniref:Cell division protein FtsX n=1 Tax=Alteromonas halophila TaxID=516698 RepID=A0A918JEG3_9ALTE|nr:lipoprotein-releasing ABC transporter permease subunit [Alteromonas halophila]GGW76738.1 cell division protein FtsX [Alteromonas halophila]